MEVRTFMETLGNYIFVDPKTVQNSVDKERFVKEAEKIFISLFQKKPDQAFWCYGYEIACAGPIPQSHK